MQIVFWILIGLVFYSYLGYTLVLFFISLFIRKPNTKPSTDSNDNLPEVTLLIAAYNEKDIIDLKTKNTASLNYPEEKLKQVWITDGSDDGSPELLKQNKDITVLHIAERQGKTAALNRAMKHIETPITVFCDANTILSENAILKLVKAFDDPKVGCVAGEKRIFKKDKDLAAGSGEGLYWQYESLIKSLESKINSTLGAAGELYAIRTKLYQQAKDDTIIDDFVISLKIAQQGLSIKYAPEAYAEETSSMSIKEELKRKIRIGAGGFQTLFRMPGLLNVFKHGSLSLQYISHKALRWMIVPIAIPLILIFNVLICYQYNWSHTFYNTLLLAQGGFYFFALIGLIFEKRSLRLKSLFLPYYLLVMNYAMILGFLKYIRGKQSAAWEKVERS